MGKEKCRTPRMRLGNGGNSREREWTRWRCEARTPGGFGECGGGKESEEDKESGSAELVRTRLRLGGERDNCIGIVISYNHVCVHVVAARDMYACINFHVGPDPVWRMRIARSEA